MPVDIGPRIGIDGEKEFRQQLQNINQQIRTLGSEMKAVTSSFEDGDRSEEALSAQTGVLNRQIDAQRQKLTQLQKGLDAAADKFGEADTKTLRWAQAVNDATADLNKMEKEMRDIDSAADKASNAMDDLGDSAQGIGGKLSGAFDGLKGSLLGGGIAGAVSGFVQSAISGIQNLVNETMEYNKIMGTLEVSSQLSGYSAEQTAQSYNQLYAIIGDQQASATALANLQALGLSQQDLTVMIDGTIGAWAKYGDSIPIDSLSEAVNETVRTGGRRLCRLKIAELSGNPKRKLTAHGNPNRRPKLARGRA